MRLPWPFGRPQRSAATPDPSDVFMVRPHGSQAWRDLPVIPRSVGKAPLIAPTPPFREELAGAAAAPIALAPLTHGHGLDAPTGLAHNVAKALSLEAGSDSGEHGDRTAPPALRRRSVASIAADVAPSDVGGMEEISAATTTSPPLRTDEPRRAPVAASSAAEARSMVRADRVSALPASPAGKVGPARAAAAAVQRAPVADSSRIDASASPTAGPPTNPAIAQIPVMSTLASVAGSDRLTLAQSRRMGLGAPVVPAALQPLHASALAHAGPESVPESSSIAASAPPSSAIERHEVGPDLTLSARVTPSDLPILSSPTSSAAAPPDPTILAPNRLPPSAVASATLWSGPQPLATPIRQRAPRSATAGQSSRPILGSRVIRSHIQRAPLTASSAPKGGAEGHGSAKSAGGAEQVRIHRGNEATEMAGAFEARAFTHAGEIYLPDSQGPLSGQKAQSLLAHEMTHVAQQRRFGSSLPSEDSSHGQWLESEAVAAETGQSLPLAISANNSTAHSASAVTSSAPDSGVPRVVDQATARVAPQRAASANDAKFTDPDDAFRDKLDSNEDYLFSKFERRLRHVLLHERERGGTLIDAL